MPRKAATKSTDLDEVEEKSTTKASSKNTKKANVEDSKENKSVTKTTKKTAEKNASKKTSTSTTSTATKKESTTTKKTAAAKKNTTKKATTTTAKSTSKKTATKEVTTSKKTTTKKASSKTSKNTSTKKSSGKTSRVSKAKLQSSDELVESPTKIELIEYYDLPYRYNQTVVKILAQTPTTLFIYWDISDSDRENFINQYGNDFFNNTKPVLVLHNLTMNYSFEIDIDDFANSWYLHVNDANCQYSVEIGRRAKFYNDEKHIDIPNNYLYVASSNTMDAPNDHILVNQLSNNIYFKNVKNNVVTLEYMPTLALLKNIKKVYSNYDLDVDNLQNANWYLDLTNPSSSNPSSTFK